MLHDLFGILRVHPERDSQIEAIDFSQRLAEQKGRLRESFFPYRNRCMWDFIR